MSYFANRAALQLSAEYILMIMKTISQRLLFSKKVENPQRYIQK